MPRNEPVERVDLATVFPCGHPQVGVLVPVSYYYNCVTCSQFYCAACDNGNGHPCPVCNEYMAHGDWDIHRCNPSALSAERRRHEELTDPVVQIREDRLRLQQDDVNRVRQALEPRPPRPRHNSINWATLISASESMNRASSNLTTLGATAAQAAGIQWTPAYHAVVGDVVESSTEASITEPVAPPVASPVVPRVNGAVIRRGGWIT